MSQDASKRTLATILVVEDDGPTRELFSLALHDEGFIVVTASNGRAALELLQSRRCDLVIVDLHMPAMDGETFLRALQALPGKPSPVLVVSAQPI